MNTLSTAIKLSLKLVNPCTAFIKQKDNIKPQHQLLNPSNPQTTIKLLQKSQLNYDSYVMRFALPQQSKCLGLKIGQYVQLHLNNQKKNYVPISRIDDPGYVDFLIRDMGDKVGTQRSFSRKLIDLNQGTNVVLKGPKTSYIYHGYGHVETKQFNKKFKRIGIIAYETGITATYSLIQSIYTNHDNETGVSLLWIGKKAQDFVFMDELGFLVQQSKLFMNLQLTQGEKGWLGGFGQVEKKNLQGLMPPADDNSVIFLAGTTKQVANLREIVNEMRYKYIVS